MSSRWFAWFLIVVLFAWTAVARPVRSDLAGPYPLLVTPWTEQAALDIPVLVKEAVFVDKAGVGGLIWPTAGEVAGLDATGEYVAGLEALARRAVDAAEPFTARVTAICPGKTSAEAVARAARVEAVAQRTGAKMAILARPPDDATNQTMIAAHYRALARVTTLPVIIQTYNGKSPQPEVSVLASLAAEFPKIYGYVKEESPGLQVNGRMEQLLARPEMKGVFSGWGAKGWIYQGPRLGTCGVISQRPAYAGLFAKIWKRIAAGADAADPELAEAYAKYLYMVNLGDVFSKYGDNEMRGPHLYVLERLGIFRNRLTKVGPGKVEEFKMSEQEKAEVDARMRFVFGSAATGVDYIPEPQPVKGPIEVTALYYPGTEHRPEWDMVEQTRPEIKPLLGWYDEGNPENVDWQIKWAVEHGISSFCVCWYWNRGEQRLDHWVKAFYRARFRRHFKWFMMYANHNQPRAHSTADQIAVSKFWIENYFKTPEYYTLDGKPVVVIWFCDAIDRDFIAEAKARGETLRPGEGVKRAFAITERMAREAGLPGVCWIDMYHGVYDPKKVDYAKGIGCRAQMIYSFDNVAWNFAPECRKPTDTRLRFDYDLVMAAAPKWWETSSRDPAFPFWPIVPTGWDARPRHFQKSSVIGGRTPEKFRALCASCRAFCERKGFDHVVIAPINEWQEGSYIEPNAEYGFGMYDALREAFCDKPASGWPRNLTPKDVGRPYHEFPPMARATSPRWTFDRTTEGWYRQPYGCPVTRCQAGALHFITSFSDNYQIRQRLVPFPAAKYRTFKLRMRVTLNAAEGMGKNTAEAPRMRLKWGTTAHPIIRPDLTVDYDGSRVCAPVKADGAWHEYELPLADDPAWCGAVDELWFEAINARHAVVDIDWMRFE